MRHKIVVDANILWSTAYRAASAVGQLLLVSDPNIVSFYAPEYLRVEVAKHFPKIVRLSGQSKAEVTTVLEAAYRKINFIVDTQIPFQHYHTAIRLVRDVDMDDVAFVALNEYLGDLLWTGDKQLFDGLRAKGYDRVVNFTELRELLQK